MKRGLTCSRRLRAAPSSLQFKTALADLTIARSSRRFAPKCCGLNADPAHTSHAVLADGAEKGEAPLR